MNWVGLAPRARVLFYLQAFSRLALFWLPACVALAFGGSFVAGPLYASLAAAGLYFLLFLAALWFPALAYERWAYALRDDDLLIARGVLVHVISAVPLGRIQHVDMLQGPIEQWMGLARVQIHTAAGMVEQSMIPGLAKADAEALRDLLIRVSGDDGV